MGSSWRHPVLRILRGVPGRLRPGHRYQAGAPIVRATREVQTGIGAVPVRAPRARDREPGSGCLSRTPALTMVVERCRSAQRTWRKSDGQALLGKVIAGVQFVDGVEIVKAAA